MVIKEIIKEINPINSVVVGVTIGGTQCKYTLKSDASIAKECWPPHIKQCFIVYVLLDVK